MIVMLRWIHNVDGLIATLKPVLYEWKQHAVLFVFAVEKRTDVTDVAQMGTGKGNWCHSLFHGVPSPYYESPARRDPPRCRFCTLAAAAKAPPLFRPHEQHAPLPNPTSIRLWYWSGMTPHQRKHRSIPSSNWFPSTFLA